ncbi:MAG: hypothetical protein EOO38_12835 [Cytophagaceae bacterium]|nr:MAG: hypothetical protein EOO38_12835 [Cytophagaceae bacterium]
MSQILAGGALSVQGPIVNQAVQVAATTEGHGDLLHTYVRSHIGASAAGNAAANNFAGAVARGASACLEVALCRNGVLTAGMAVAISAEIERTRIANPEMSDRAVQTLAVSAVLAHSVVDGVTSVYDAFVSSPQGKFDPETGGYGAGSVPKLPNNTGNTAPPPNYGSNTGGNQVVDENLVGQIHGGGYASGETPAYGGSTITPNNELVSSSLVMAVPAGDLNSINEALSGTMGAPPNIVRGGTTNVISEYPNGNWSDANNAFDKLKLTDVRSISSGYGQGRTGTLANGTQVTVRPSQDGRPTIQIIDTNRPGGARSVAEIRFEPK